MLPTKVKAWLSRFKKYYFTYGNGFWHFTYNQSSPETLVDSFKDLPFVQHSLERQSVMASMPVQEGGFYYRKLEEGCWIIYSKVRYKLNVAYDLFYEQGSDNDYYMLGLNNIANSARVPSSFRVGQVNFTNRSWSLAKPRVVSRCLNFKGDDCLYLTLFFNEDWLQRNLAAPFREAGLEGFLQSGNDHIILPLAQADAPQVEAAGQGAEHWFARFDTAMSLVGEPQPVDMVHLRQEVLALAQDFCAACRSNPEAAAGDKSLAHADWFGLNKVAHHLNTHLFGKFPGIDSLSEQFDIAPTSLKTGFRQLFGHSPYQYFREKQMLVARTLLLDHDVQIRKVAETMGYSSESKFSTAFKKHLGILPSEL